MGIFEAIVGFFTALPALVKLGQELFNFLKKIAGADPQGFIKDMGLVMEKLNNAKTSEERTSAALDLHRLIRRL